MKSEAWESALEQVRQLKDANGVLVDEGIEDAVAAMGLLGFMTCMSCWGHSDRRTGGPYVMISSEEAKRLEGEWRVEAGRSGHSPGVKEKRDLASNEGARVRYRMHELLVDFYAKRSIDYNSVIVLRTIGYSTTWVGVQSVWYSNILSDEHHQELLVQARKEMSAFTEFLKSKIK